MKAIVGDLSAPPSEIKPAGKDRLDSAISVLKKM